MINGHHMGYTYPTKTSTTLSPSPNTFHISTKAPQRFICESTGAKTSGRHENAGFEGWEVCRVCTDNGGIGTWWPFEGYVCNVEPGREGGRELDRETGPEGEVDGARGGGANSAKRE